MRLQTQLAPFQYGANARDDVTLAFDSGCKLWFKAVQFFDGSRVHG